MKYRLKWDLPHDPTTCLGWLLAARGIEDAEGYVNVGSESELDPYLLDNIEEAAELLLRHLRQNSKMLLIVDADSDGYASAAMLYNYIKDFFPSANLTYLCHEHKGHGLSDLQEEVDKEHWDLILLPDAGSNDYSLHAYYKTLGTDILVLD